MCIVQYEWTRLLLLSSAPSSFVEQEGTGLQLHLFDHLGLFFHPGLRRLRLVDPLALSVCGRVGVCSFVFAEDLGGMGGVEWGGGSWRAWSQGDEQVGI